MGNIVKQYELALCKNEQKKIDAMIAEQDVIYNPVNAFLIKIVKSKIYKGNFSKCDDIEKKKQVWEHRNNVLLFVNKKGEEIRGITEYSIGKLISHLFPNTLVNSTTRNNISKHLNSAWDKFFNGETKSFPKFHTDKNRNKSNGFAWNVGVTNYRKGHTRFTYIIDKETNRFCLDFNNPRSKVQNKARKVQGQFKFRTNKNKKIGFRDNQKKFEWFDKDLDIATLGIVRKEIRGKKRYFLSVTYSVPDVKPQPIDENLRVGIDINLNNYAIYSSQFGCWGIPSIKNNKDKENKDKDWYQYHFARLKHLQNRLDKERRKANPNSYRKDGTICGKLEVITPQMIFLNDKIGREYRRITEYRKNYQGWISNIVIGWHPSVIKWEDNIFLIWVKRAKDGYGRHNKKKRYGAQIHKSAPYGLKLLLQRKCKANGINFVLVKQTIGCTRFDCTNGESNAEFAKLTNRTHVTSDGLLHSRDLISAYNISCCVGYKTEKKSKISKGSDLYANEIDKDLALRDYEKFCLCEEKEINILKENNIQNGLI